MKSFIFVILIIFLFSCHNNIELNGKWERVKYLDEERIPQVKSYELGAPLSFNLIIEITNDSITFTQENISRSVNYQLDNNYLLFPDNKYNFEVKWKVIEHDNRYLLIERNLGGIGPNYEKIKFKKL